MNGFCRKCPAREYAKNDACLICPLGHKCENGIKTRCHSGQYWKNDDKFCYNCPAGHFCQNFNLPVACPDGMNPMNPPVHCEFIQSKVDFDSKKIRVRRFVDSNGFKIIFLKFF